MKPLESRKQLLIAESDLNREELLRDWQTMTDEVRSLTSQARTIGSFASAAAAVVAGLASSRRKKPAPVVEKPSWWQTLLKYGGLVSTLWQALRPQGQDQTNKDPSPRV